MSVGLHDLKASLKADGTLICFAGELSHGIIEELGRAVRRYLELEQLEPSSLMDVFAVFVEQTQNVSNYAARKVAQGNTDHAFHDAIVVIGKSGDRHVVSSGNVVDRNDVGELVARLDQLRALDAPGIKAAYKKQLRRDAEPGRGPGLGLIDMARRAAQPLEYSLRDLEGRYTFFTLRTVV
jgi:hypothetical protein